MELVAKNHEFVTEFKAFPSCAIITQDHIILRDSWKEKVSPYVDPAEAPPGSAHLHIAKALPPDWYAEKVEQGIDFSDSSVWCNVALSKTNRFSPCYVHFSDFECFYCEMLQCCPGVQLQEIESALLDANGTLQQRMRYVLDDFRRRTTMKPARS